MYVLRILKYFYTFWITFTKKKITTMDTYLFYLICYDPPPLCVKKLNGHLNNLFTLFV